MRTWFDWIPASAGMTNTFTRMAEQERHSRKSGNPNKTNQAGTSFPQKRESRKGRTYEQQTALCLHPGE